MDRYFRRDAPALSGLTDFAELDGDPSAFDAVFALPCLNGVDRKQLFTAIRGWACEYLQRAAAAPEDALRPLDCPGVRELSAADCRGLLANAALDNLKDPMEGMKRNRGGLDFRRCGMVRQGVGHQRFAALLLYFESGRRAAFGDADDRRAVRFERIRCPDAASFGAAAAACDSALIGGADAAAGSVALHAGRMEDVPHDAFVNFANADFGYGCFIASATQEEILQACCPEMNAGMLFIGSMADDEVVVVRRCRRYTKYTGYLDTYSCAGLLEPASSPVADILALDACHSGHFGEGHVLRDVRKACAAFGCMPRAAGAPAPVVSSGRWGCGVFGGLPTHKFVQQAIAARLGGVTLRFSTGSSADGVDTILEACRDAELSVAQAWRLLLRCRSRAEFEAAFLSGRLAEAAAPEDGRAAEAESEEDARERVAASLEEEAEECECSGRLGEAVQLHRMAQRVRDGRAAPDEATRLLAEIQIAAEEV